jgi:hypothetical protein
MKPSIRLICGAATLLAAASCQNPAPPAQQQGELPANASVTVFPVLLGGNPSPDVANVVGIMLERGGLQQVELEAATFTPDKGQDFAAQAAAFGAFAAKHGLKTDFALFASFQGSQRRVEAVNGALVDKQGKVVWFDRQQQGSQAFDKAKPGEPLECVMLLAQQLRTPLRLLDPLREGAPASKLEQRMKQKAGVPPKAEFDAMAARLLALRKAGKPSIRVFPARVGTDWSADSAKALAAAIEQAGFATAAAAIEPIRFTVQASSNEQQVLWSAAKSIQEAVRAAPPQQAYLLFTDFLMAGKDEAGAVHTFLLSPAGEFVVVDYQNSHHEDFQRLSPASAEDCCRLAAIRLESRLKN